MQLELEMELIFLEFLDKVDILFKGSQNQLELAYYEGLKGGIETSRNMLKGLISNYEKTKK